MFPFQNCLLLSSFLPAGATVTLHSDPLLLKGLHRLPIALVRAALDDLLQEPQLLPAHSCWVSSRSEWTRLLPQAGSPSGLLRLLTLPHFPRWAQSFLREAFPNPTSRPGHVLLRTPGGPLMPSPILGVIAPAALGAPRPRGVQGLGHIDHCVWGTGGLISPS